jgi:hypothetical protein
MKPPTEADLIEIENHVLKIWQIAEAEGENRPCRIVATLEYLIARARFHNARQSQRTSVSKPAPTVQPNSKKESR